jgi:hypothetical protein
MRRAQFNGRRFLVHFLIGVNVVIWGAGVTWAQENAKLPESKPAEYVSDTFKFRCQDIRVWRFDSKEKQKRPAVLLLHGADGGVGAPRDNRYSAARRCTPEHACQNAFDTSSRPG